MCLQKIFFVWILLACSQHLLPGGGFKDHSIPTALTGRFDGKTPAQRPQVRWMDGGMFGVWGKDDRVRSVKAAADEFQVHGGFIPRPDGTLLRIHAKRSVPDCPIHQRLEARIGFGSAVEEGCEGNFPIFQSCQHLVQGLRGDLQERHAARSAGGFDQVDEVGVILPVPGQAQVVTRHLEAL